MSPNGEDAAVARYVPSGVQGALLVELVMSENSRLRWQCRRGMRELDELLLRYLEHHYAGANAQEKADFRAVLDLADPELNAYLLQRQTPASKGIARVVKRILS